MLLLLICSRLLFVNLHILEYASILNEHDIIHVTGKYGNIRQQDTAVAYFTIISSLGVVVFQYITLTVLCKRHEPTILSETNVWCECNIPALCVCLNTVVLCKIRSLSIGHLILDLRVFPANWPILAVRQCEKHKNSTKNINKSYGHTAKTYADKMRINSNCQIMQERNS